MSMGALLPVPCQTASSSSNSCYCEFRKNRISTDNISQGDSILESHIPSLWASFLRITFLDVSQIHTAENMIMFNGGGGKGRWINWETGNDMYMLLYIKQVTDKDLLYSTGNSTQYSLMTYMGKECKKESMRSQRVGHD